LDLTLEQLLQMSGDTSESAPKPKIQARAAATAASDEEYARQLAIIQQDEAYAQQLQDMEEQQYEQNSSRNVQQEEPTEDLGEKLKQFGVNAQKGVMNFIDKLATGFKQPATSPQYTNLPEDNFENNFMVGSADDDEVSMVPQSKKTGRYPDPS
jgi:hypothetical protein